MHDPSPHILQDGDPNILQDDSVPNNSQSSAPNPAEIISDFIAGWITNHNTEPSDEDTQELKPNEDLKRRIDSLRSDLIIFFESVASLRSKIMERMEDEEFRAYKQQMTSWFNDGSAWHQNADDLLRSQVSTSQDAILLEFNRLDSKNSELEKDVCVTVAGISFNFNSQRLASQSARFARKIQLKNKRPITFSYSHLMRNADPLSRVLSLRAYFEG